MTRAVRLLAALLTAGLVLTGTACQNNATPGSGSGSSAAAAPAGGWPQAADGVIDEKMCRILTSADFATFNRIATDKVETSKPYAGRNGITCNYALDDTLTLELDGNAAVAAQTYQVRLGDHRRRAGRTGSTFTTALVTGADDSWFDEDPLSPSGEHKDTVLVARRGALLLQIHLQGWFPGGQKSDPKATSAGLAGLVLQRAPQLGLSSGPAPSGTAASAPVEGHHVQLSVTGTGTGTAKIITYLDPVDGKTKQLNDVKLPWVIVLPLAGPAAGVPVLLDLSAGAGNPSGYVGCTITIDGKQVAKDTKPGALTFCTYSWHS
jgi:hypothetical protein